MLAVSSSGVQIASIQSLESGILEESVSFKSDERTYQKTTGDENEDTTSLIGRLGIETGNLVLDLGEGKASELLGNCSSTLDRRVLKGEHGVLFLFVAIKELANTKIRRDLSSRT